MRRHQFRERWGGESDRSIPLTEKVTARPVEFTSPNSPVNPNARKSL
ncbi:hypothetical protein L1F28_06625 [Arthrospira platensis NCB002]|nr:hypothetical protein [Arthrospira platensis NCB002]QQW28936.1 hypothetical protein AP9108_29680 [Arthrospira sp. PCC 9108]QQW28938.1 hypothetical protein AP9108_29690 [Arthrospira sp. PCC 9108]